MIAARARLSRANAVPEDPLQAMQGLTLQPSSDENCEIPLAKIYENSLLHHLFCCACNRRANPGLLREHTRDDHDHDHNASDYRNGAASFCSK